MSKNPYIIFDKNKVINYYTNHTLIECGNQFNCCEETIKRRLIRWGINIRTKKESKKMFFNSDKSKDWRIKKSKLQKDKYTKYGKEMFTEKFRKNIGSFKTKPLILKGEKNGNYKGGNSPKYWTARVIAHYGTECDICNWDKVVEVLECHHKDFNRKNNTIENGQVLCPTCHRIIHFKERGFK